MADSRAMTVRRGIAAILFVLALTGCGDGDISGEVNTADEPAVASSTAAPAPTPLEDASQACGEEKVGNPLDPDNQELASNYLSIEDDGQTLIVGGGDQFATGPTAFCVLEQLGAPASTVSKVEGTTAMMGQLTDEFEGYEVTWSFHPDNGLDMIVESPE